MAGGPGMVMQATPAVATAQQRAAAAQLAAATRVGIARYADIRLALADGYRPATAPAAATVHYRNPAYVADGRVLDPTRPEELVYANTAGGPRLLGAMYLLAKPGLPGPDIGGPLTRWHVHTNLCIGPGAAIVGIVSPFGLCPAGSVNVATPAMLHVWSVESPGGPFGELDPAFLAQLGAR